jgi:hypothetical protein
MLLRQDFDDWIIATSLTGPYTRYVQLFRSEKGAALCA